MSGLTRRAMFGGLIGLAAPAIIRTPGLLMPVRTLIQPAVAVLPTVKVFQWQLTAIKEVSGVWRLVRPAAVTP